MRRKDKQITDSDIIENVIQSSYVCRVAFHDNEYPYVIPFNYGYCNNTFYFHSASEGKKIDLINVNNKVCIEIDYLADIVKQQVPCKWTAKYRSIIGFGEIEIVTDDGEKRKGLDIIMAHYGRAEKNNYYDQNVKSIIILKLKINSISCKQSGNWEEDLKSGKKF